VRESDVFEFPRSRKVTQAYIRYATVAFTTLTLWTIGAMFVAIGVISLTVDEEAGPRRSIASTVVWLGAGAVCIVASIAIDIRILSRRSLRVLPLVFLLVLLLALAVSQIALRRS
jgi:cell division protein FtsW (lipid II flippase)